MLKAAVLCKSDSTGGAAIVSRRLTEALRGRGVDARMLVLEKLSNLPYIIKADYSHLREQAEFIAERGQIFLANGFSRKNLFKADTASFGLPLWNHPVVKEADVVILNWVNQGMLSLKGVKKICDMGKRVIWTMHDLWNFTGICHHPMGCRRFLRRCGSCPLLLNKKNDLSNSIWVRKNILYKSTDIRFVAVSNWLAQEAAQSSLLKKQRVTVIPNPFRIFSADDRKIASPASMALNGEERPRKILFAAATLDNWIKGFDTFKESIAVFAAKYPVLSKNSEVVLLGNLKDPSKIEDLALPVVHRGMITGDEAIAETFGEADVIVNTSHFENLPGTLVEGQAYGAVPVAFDRGGQSDIIKHGVTGFLAPWSDDLPTRAGAIADGIAWAIAQQQTRPDEIRFLMRRNVETRFSYEAVAKAYMELINAAGRG